MPNLIVYGSLLNKDELKKHNITDDMIDFVKVKGFKRIFNQEPSWRKVKSNYRAVMNVQVDKNFWFNAILLKNLDEKYFMQLDKREIGYDRTIIKDGNVTTYNGNIVNNCIIYKGKAGKQNNKILPNKDYLAICKNGARSHFSEFYDDYISTTYFNK
jgi:hypothetical protein